ncbi:MAG TPA: FtsQ-type POTRA domain-containing protein [Acidobacteriota bacterium]|nr:FtsQ-type POTRA domain-containing protein [Acidobacteriota bacterium]
MAKAKKSTSARSRWKQWRAQAPARLATGLKTVLSALAVAVVGLFLYQSWASPSGRPYFALEHVRFQGLERVDPAYLRGLLQDSARGNILHVDLDQVRRQVESATWVESAVVRRRLPDELVISVRERTAGAVAQVGDEILLVDRHGVLLDPYDPKFELDVPIVVGLSRGGQNARLMKRYWTVVEDLRSGETDYTRHISDIDVSRPQVAVTSIDERVSVILGEKDFNKRFRIFLSQVEKVREARRQHGAIQEVDVSFPNRLIIRTARQGQPEVALSR